ncbi:MAG: hypothetical protein M3Y78_11875 [Pseudomonadota bacterium]|nr:hypothetical protein [Pseudomonadota bacterium]
MPGLQASIVLKALAASALLAGAGCQSSSPEPQQMARTTLQTAPADLQLLCASAVATQTGAASDKVLPVSSRQLDASSFQVELDAAGSRHSCVVDNEGNVRSVT